MVFLSRVMDRMIESEDLTRTQSSRLCVENNTCTHHTFSLRPTVWFSACRRADISPAPPGSSVRCPDSKLPPHLQLPYPFRPVGKHNSGFYRFKCDKSRLLTSLMSPTSRFFVSGPGPLLSAGGPVTGVHGDEMVPGVTTLPAKKKLHYTEKPILTHRPSPPQLFIKWNIQYFGSLKSSEN